MHYQKEHVIFHRAKKYFKHIILHFQKLHCKLYKLKKLYILNPKVHFHKKYIL